MTGITERGTTMHLLRLTIALLITAATLAVVTLCPGRY
jgi:hypothetical protein